MTGLWSKVKAGGAGAGLGSLVGTFLVWLLGATAWGAGADASQVEAALAAVPAPVSGLLIALVALAGSVLAGYVTTERVAPAGAAEYAAGDHAVPSGGLEYGPDGLLK